MIFPKIKLKQKVDRIFFIRKKTKIEGIPREYPKDGLGFELAERFMIEFEGSSVSIVTVDRNNIGIEAVRVSLFNRKGKLVGQFGLEDMLYSKDKDVTRIAIALVDVFYTISNLKSETTKADLDSGRIAVFEPKGDGPSIRRIEASVAHEHLGNVRADIIKKRLHGVRGHWRTLANGKQVWVRAHERGDETLGRITTQVSIF